MPAIRPSLTCACTVVNPQSANIDRIINDGPSLSDKQSVEAAFSPGASSLSSQAGSETAADLVCAGTNLGRQMVLCRCGNGGSSQSKARESPTTVLNLHPRS